MKSRCRFTFGCTTQFVFLESSPGYLLQQEAFKWCGMAKRFQNKKFGKVPKKPPKVAHSKPSNIFENRRSFPAFSGLPEENELDLRYYREGLLGYVPSRSWCFLGEITNDDFAQLPVFRNRVLVRDHRGQENIVIAFYPKSGIFDFSTLKKGHTVCVMFAHQHLFLDLTIGVRIEDLDAVKVIPCGLDDLFALAKHHFKSSNTCWGCGKEEASACSTSSSTSATVVSAAQPALKKCTACKVARYCNKQCQAKDWKERHRVWCKAMPVFLKLTSVDYRKYNKDAYFR